MVGVVPGVHLPSWSEAWPYPLGNPFKPANGTKMILLLSLRTQRYRTRGSVWNLGS